jgi:hypothetical protein
VTSDLGLITLSVIGVVNPSSFQQSLPFEAIHTIDADSFMSQNTRRLSSHFLQTDIEAEI